MSDYPKYRSHKVVEAFKIGEIQEMISGAMLVPADLDLPHHRVNHDYLGKHSPAIGGYWVRYADGYESWSPAEAFEEGYTRLDEPGLQPAILGGCLHRDPAPFDLRQWCLEQALGYWRSQTVPAKMVLEFADALEAHMRKPVVAEKSSG